MKTVIRVYQKNNYSQGLLSCCQLSWLNSTLTQPLFLPQPLTTQVAMLLPPCLRPLGSCLLTKVSQNIGFSVKRNLKVHLCQSLIKKKLRIWRPTEVNNKLSITQHVWQILNHCINPGPKFWVNYCTNLAHIHRGWNLTSEIGKTSELFCITLLSKNKRV